MLKTISFKLFMVKEEDYQTSKRFWRNLSVDNKLEDAMSKSLCIKFKTIPGIFHYPDTMVMQGMKTSFSINTISEYGTGFYGMSPTIPGNEFVFVPWSNITAIYLCDRNLDKPREGRERGQP
jgi:hypothetical protein